MGRMRANLGDRPRWTGFTSGIILSQLAALSWAPIKTKRGREGGREGEDEIAME